MTSFPSLARALCGGLLACLPAFGQAALLQITTPLDEFDGVCDVHCSLRDGVVTANRSGQPSVLLLPAGTYLLDRPAALDAQGVPRDDEDPTLGDLDVGGRLYIRGQGADLSIVRGQANDRLFEILPGAVLVLEKLSLEQGSTAHTGGALKNRGDLALLGVRARHNQAIRPAREDVPVSPEEVFRHGQGGAIANYGRLLVQGSRIEENRARGTPYGTWNVVPGRGAGLYNEGRLLLRDSLLHRNADLTAGGDWGAVVGLALYNRGQARIERSSLVDHGGWEDFHSVVVNDGGRLEVRDSTFSDSVFGAVVNYQNASATLERVTITDGYGNALVNHGRMRVRNSIVAGNINDQGDPSNCFNRGDFRSQGLLLNSGESTWGACPADHYLPFEETFSRVLQASLNREHPYRWFHPLLPGSPAIDAAQGACAGVDQRGVARPQDGDGDGLAVCDLGAYERLTP